MQNGARIRYAGLVICRQRPGTAGGVVFMTLEDETGFVNVVMWESVFQRYAVLAKTVSFLGITGKLQVEDGVVHLVAERLWEPRVELKPAKRAQPGFSLRGFNHKEHKDHKVQEFGFGNWRNPARNAAKQIQFVFFVPS